MKQIISLMLFMAFMVSSYAQSDTLIYKIKKASNKNNQVLLILLHGFGANEQDLFELSQFFPDNYTIVSPRATFTIQQGAYQWYKSIHTSNSFEGDNSDLEKSHFLIRQLTTRLQKQLHIGNSHTVIAGFSQGANMSYQMGLLYPGLCKGIGVFSGTIFNSQKEKILQHDNTSLSIFIGHGKQDDRIPFSFAESSNVWLKTHHFTTNFYSYAGMGHAISPEEIRDFLLFIKNTLR